MTKSEIQTLIAKTIEGQGNQVDAGGKLGTILNAILDLADGSGGGTFVPLTDWTTETVTEAVAATKYGLTDEEWEKLISGKYTYVATFANGTQAFPIVLWNESFVVADYLVKNGDTFIDNFVRIQRNAGQNYVITYQQS